MLYFFKHITALIIKSLRLFAFARNKYHEVLVYSIELIIIERFNFVPDPKYFS
jgi:hypothetical protein